MQGQWVRVTFPGPCGLAPIRPEPRYLSPRTRPVHTRTLLLVPLAPHLLGLSLHCSCNLRTGLDGNDPAKVTQRLTELAETPVRTDARPWLARVRGRRGSAVVTGTGLGFSPLGLSASSQALCGRRDLRDAGCGVRPARALKHCGFGPHHQQDVGPGFGFSGKERGFPAGGSAGAGSRGGTRGGASPL